MASNPLPYNPMTDTSKLESTTIFNVGEVITGIQKGRLDDAKPEAVIYCTIDGRIGMLHPFHGDEEQEMTVLRKL